MTDRLILLTSVFPCLAGEEFLEAEITYLAKQFDDILVIPTYLRNQSTAQTRQLPPNARLVLPVEADDAHVRPLSRRVASAATSELVGHPLPPHLWAVDMRFAVTSMSLFDRVARALALAGVDPADGAVIYSYWLFKPAAVAIELRDRYFHGNAVAVSRAHRYDVYPDQGVFGHLPAREYLVDGLDRMFPISDSARDEIVKIPGADPAVVEVARLGVSEAPAEINRIRRTPLSVVSCSSLASVKRVPAIIEAMRLVHERQPGAVHWTHIGDSGEESLAELRRQIESAGIADHAVAVGRKTNSEVLRHYLEGDVSFFLNFSSSEGVPVSIMEAHAYSIPVIATDVGGTREIVESGTNGYLLPADASPTDLAETLLAAAALTDGEYKTMSQGALTTWAKMSNARAQYETFSKRLRQLADSLTLS